MRNEAFWCSFCVFATFRLLRISSYGLGICKRYDSGVNSGFIASNLGGKLTKCVFFGYHWENFMLTVSEDELVALFKQGVAGNSTGFTLLARRFVSSIRNKNPEAVEKLSELVTNPHTLRNADRELPVDRDTRASLLLEQSHVVLKEEPLWNENVEDKLSLSIKERENTKKLIDAGLEPIKALLFTGPPGVGKTLGASWLAYNLDLPLLTLDLSNVMSSLLGKTGVNIKSVFDYASSKPCVLFLDEFDAVAKKRDDEKDVGELKRLVNVLLQSVDSWPSTSLLIAATNHPELLDRAIWRRFDDVIEFDLPGKDEVYNYFKKIGLDEKTSRKVAPLMSGKSYSDLRKIVFSAKKMSVLEDISFDDAVFRQVLFGGSGGGESLRASAIKGAVSAGVSRRKIAELTGLSHPTISKIVNAKG